MKTILSIAVTSSILFSSVAVADDSYLPKFLSSKAKAAVEDSIKNKLLDPFSAVIVFKKATPIMACGEVNAKNKFGGFVGFNAFVVMYKLESDGKSYSTVPLIYNGRRYDDTVC